MYARTPIDSTSHFWRIVADTIEQNAGGLKRSGELNALRTPQF
jgi:hypothetical protein